VVQEGHGGSLTVESVFGQGTTFAVRIPINGLVQEELVGAGMSSSSATTVGSY
jgi:light-regulated signal transduction histidine kinase (bacteriophytochrome)